MPLFCNNRIKIFYYRIDSLSRLDQLFHSKHYTEVAEILKTTFVCIGGPPTCGRMGRPAQLGMLMDSLWYTDQKECFIWTEKCLRETVEHFIKPQKERLKWELVLKKCLEILNLIIKEETVSIGTLKFPAYKTVF